MKQSEMIRLAFWFSSEKDTIKGKGLNITNLIAYAAEQTGLPVTNRSQIRRAAEAAGVDFNSVTVKHKQPRGKPNNHGGRAYFQVSADSAKALALAKENAETIGSLCVLVNNLMDSQKAKATATRPAQALYSEVGR